MLGGDGVAYVCPGLRLDVQRNQTSMGGGRYSIPLREASPEDLTQAPVDARSVVYWLSLLLYSLVVAKVPLEGDNEYQTYMNITEGRLVPPSELNPNISAPLEALILKGMSLKPAARHQSLGDFEAALLALLKAQVRQDVDADDVHKALVWFRGKVYDGDTTAILGALERHPRLAAQPEVAQYIWSHIRTSVLDCLERCALPAWHTLLLMGHLKPARQALEGMLAECSGGSRLALRWLLGRPDSALSKTHLDGLVSQEAFVDAQRLSAPVAQTVVIEPCYVAWEGLQPLDGVDPSAQRFCAHCQKTVTCALNQSHLLSLVLEGQCVRRDPEIFDRTHTPQSTFVESRTGQMNAASDADDTGSMVVERSLLDRFRAWWRR